MILESKFIITKGKIKMKTNYKTRMIQAYKNFKNADPKNQAEVKKAYALYIQAVQNYNNTKGA